MRSNSKRAIITLDLEPDHAGRLPDTYSLWTEKNITTLKNYFDARKVPLTVFVVAKTLPRFHALIGRLTGKNASLHIHSFSHNLNEPDSDEEIQRSIATYKKYYHRMPLGYRAPEGRISKEGWYRLRAHGIRFDASELPSFWPKPANVVLPVQPMYQPVPTLWEFPFTVLTRLRIPFTLSWIKLFGWDFYSWLLHAAPLPPLVVFSFHMHDLWQAKESGQLPWFWRQIYRRHAGSGFEYFERVLYYLQTNGYIFTTINNLLEEK